MACCYSTAGDLWRPLLCARLPPLDIVKGNAHMLSFGFSCDCSSYFFFVGCGSRTKALKKTDACHTQHSVAPAAWYSCSRSSLCASLMFSVLFAVPFQLQFFALIRKCACKTRLVLPPCCLRLPPHKKVA